MSNVTPINQVSEEFRILKEFRDSIHSTPCDKPVKLSLVDKSTGSSVSLETLLAEKAMTAEDYKKLTDNTQAIMRFMEMQPSVGKSTLLVLETLGV